MIICLGLSITNFLSIIVRISAEVTKPREDRPFDGLFNINLELTNMGSPAWENGRYEQIYNPSKHIIF